MGDIMVMRIRAKWGALGVLMAIGIFELDGGAAAESTYEITSPIFEKITIQLNPNYYPGDQFIIETKNISKDNLYMITYIYREQSLMGSLGISTGFP